MVYHHLSGSDGEESACNEGDLGLIPGSRRPRKRAWQSTPVFLTGESHGQRSLVGYSPWGQKQLDTSEQLTVTNLYMTVIFSSNCGVKHNSNDKRNIITMTKISPY